MKDILLLLLIISLWSCDSSNEDGSQVLTWADKIPNIELLEGDERLSRSNDGKVLLDTALYSGYLMDYYPNGNLKSSKGYYEGKLEGDFTSYYPSGQIYTLRPYHLGEKHGEHLAYYENGKLKFQYTFIEGLSEGTHHMWFKNGELKMEMNYKNGKERGLQRVWRPDGKIRSNYVVRENGRQYGMLGLKRCAKVDSETGDIDPYRGSLK